ncbi:nitrogen regulatory protein P-II (GlnB, GlnK) [Rhodopseudomonas palustris HaA2]|uniref:Nitrogen regulatory protein P-II n=1 Tax=Rhodopseudomonas palustris (strain HaA2) TaxID=316058 RepID=Q2ITD6_RHOP2|nr:nitrogen regulatory protein P-II [Rhodopseudomonas palustris]ABD08524.1 nitrogen regulatory protein P-II (GlnB, GlnK) [Rhodopseudomonas palustris HaA2]
MQTFPKKRIEIVVEAPLLRRLTSRLDEAGATGWSVVPILAGHGRDGDWTAEGQISSASQMLMLISIVDAARLDTVLEAVFALVSHQIGFVAVSDIAVVRPERF